jgi:hypothetical protein
MDPARTNPGPGPREPGFFPVMGRGRGVTAEYEMSTRITATLRLADCRSPAGPLILLQTVLGLAPLHVRVTLRDRPPSDEAPPWHSADVPLVLPGECMERSLQTVRLAPGKPMLTLRFSDRDHQPLANAVPFGACTDGIRSVEVPVRLKVHSTVWVVAHRASGAGGPKLWLSGKLVLPCGVTARLGMRPVEGEADGDEVTIDLPLFHPRTAFFFYERAVDCGLPEDAWARLRLLDEKDAPIGEEQTVRPLSAA